MSIFFCATAYGQMTLYDYKREVIGVSGQWHKVVLPNEVFGKTSQNLNDIRILGITASHDTVEAPYFLRLTDQKKSGKEILFKTLNASYDVNGYYITFEIPTAEPINEISLNFRQKNFDWRVKLEGSEDQNNWFTILNDYRILSIKNDITDFQFTRLKFPDSKYRYFRVQINSNEKPDLVGANIERQEFQTAKVRNYAVNNIVYQEDRKYKRSEIDIELQMPVPVSAISLHVKDLFDYYRPIRIEYLADSLKTERGWSFEYQPLLSGTLNSIDTSALTFNSTIVQKLKIIVSNDANQPLTIDSIQVKGYEHELIVRFTKQAHYFLTYGNRSATSPAYDIDHFADKVPLELTALQLGDEQVVEKTKAPSGEPLFRNNIWLWVVMGLIMLVLGWFSIRMMRDRNHT